MKNYYQILGISASSDEHQIKTAYRKLALKYHPDKNSSDEASFLILQINEAYRVLGNPEKRKKYDLQLLYLNASKTRTIRKPPSKPYQARRKKNPDSDRKPFYYLEYGMFFVLFAFGLAGLFLTLRDWFLHGYQENKTNSGLVFGLVFTGLLTGIMLVMRQKRKP